MRIYILGSELEKHGINPLDSNFPSNAIDYIQENYFNGADNAIIYLGPEYRMNNSFEFEILPN